MTRNAMKNNPDVYEGNPLISGVLGKRPSDLGLGLYTVGMSALHPLIAKNMDEPYRTIFQVLTNGIRGWAINNNFQLGARIKL